MTASVQAGKAVLCEKPIDLDLARVDACWADIKDLGATIMVGFNRRFDPSFAEMRDRVAKGEIGRLEQLIITSRDPAPAPAAYIATSGGLFRDMTIHDFDMARFFLGEVVEVQAMGANLIEPYIAEAGDIDSAMVVLRGAGGELGQIINSRRCSFGYDQRVEAFGAEAMLTAGNQTASSVRRSGASGTENAPPYLNFFLDRYADAYRAELDHLVSCVEQGTAPSPGFADGRAALVLADAANESLKTGRAVRVDAAPWDPLTPRCQRPWRPRQRASRCGSVAMVRLESRERAHSTRGPRGAAASAGSGRARPGARCGPAASGPPAGPSRAECCRRW